MRDVVEILPFVVVVGVLVIGVLQLVSHGDVYDEIGGGGLARGEATGGAISPSESDDEIRQMLEARNARRARQGRPALDVDAEWRRLTAVAQATGGGLGAERAAAADPALEQEVRDLVMARNARRARRGQPPLDVDEEVKRQLREL
jgi:hypothetical protein